MILEKYTDKMIDMLVMRHFPKYAYGENKLINIKEKYAEQSEAKHFRNKLRRVRDNQFRDFRTWDHRGRAKHTHTHIYLFPSAFVQVMWW